MESKWKESVWLRELRLRLEVLAVGGERRREAMARILSQAREESVGCLDRFPLSSNNSATRGR